MGSAAPWPPHLAIEAATLLAQCTGSPRRRIVVVERVPLIADCTSETLCDAGYDIQLAGSCAEAWRLLEQHEDEIAALFASVTMAERDDEYAIIRAAAERWPSLSILVTAAHHHPSCLEMPKDAIFIPKPYGSFEVAGQLRSMLAGKRIDVLRAAVTLAVAC